MGKNLLLIEITDSDISYLLNSLRIIFCRKQFNAAIHITIKGPQKTFRRKEIDKFIATKEPIYIKDTGIFINENTYIVYMKVKCKTLKGYIWRKIDYKNEYNPHITLYKGSEKHIAYAVFNFLKGEHISLVANKYQIKIHSLEQLNLFPPIYHYDDCGFKALVKQGCIKSDILSRAKQMIAEVQKKNVLPFKDRERS
jgi:hypothetical protein